MSKNDGTRMIFRLPPALFPGRTPALALVALIIAGAGLLSGRPAMAQATEEAASAPESSASAPAPLVVPLPRPLPAAPPQPATPSTLPPPPTWQGLSRTQQLALAPLQRDWDALDPMRKSKWLEIAPRFLYLPSEEQARMHERMRAWSRLSPAQRQQARIGYQVAQQVKADDRQAKWEAYQALSPERRQELADKAISKLVRPAPKLAAGADLGQAKSNLIPALPRNLPSMPVAPSVLQAKPGASTVLITQPKTPPSHQRAGQTKVFADPDLVDSKTLLPKQRLATAPQ